MSGILSMPLKGSGSTSGGPRPPGFSTSLYLGGWQGTRIGAGALYMGLRNQRLSLSSTH